MRLVVGLGNPGDRYKNTRHNIGARVVECFAEKHKIRIRKRRFNALIGEGRVKSEHLWCLLPQTFMNLSGDSVGPARGKIEELSELLIVYDDIDLRLGNLRFRPGGSSGGQKGLKSIIEKLGTKDIPRLRVGIRSGDAISNTADFVLRPFLKEEKKVLQEVVTRAVAGVETWISKGIIECMTRYNKKVIKDD